ncbi:MAG: phosphoenolpyruvate synthase, partial [Legionellales bacterium]|nr:phosphoenolpyruvate synthase [Legionellales bacterium]
MQNYFWFDEINMNDISTVGGKNASLGEMISKLSAIDVEIPFGFATTAEAFRDFITSNGLDSEINTLLENVDVDNVSDLQTVGKMVRDIIIKSNFNQEFVDDITNAYNKLLEKSGDGASFAVRSSATAEDLATASFAGQQETFLNIS